MNLFVFEGTGTLYSIRSMHFHTEIKRQKKTYFKNVNDYLFNLLFFDRGCKKGRYMYFLFLLKEFFALL